MIAACEAPRYAQSTLLLSSRSPAAIHLSSGKNKATRCVPSSPDEPERDKRISPRQYRAHNLTVPLSLPNKTIDNTAPTLKINNSR